jgi:hypothetical protein
VKMLLFDTLTFPQNFEKVGTEHLRLLCGPTASREEITP